ncbi:MAG: hypothetical protein ACK55I_40230, partial [bacterium]
MSRRHIEPWRERRGRRRSSGRLADRNCWPRAGSRTSMDQAEPRRLCAAPGHRHRRAWGRALL